MTTDPIGDDLRKLRRARRLGTTRICVLCGEADTASLTKTSRSLLERHHLAGRVNDRDLVVVVCLNCHARLSEAQRDDSIDLRASESRTSLERLQALLGGLADFSFELGRALRGWSDELARLIRRLDESSPGWRRDTQ